MTPERKARIEQLAVIAQKKSDKFMALGMRNIAGRLAGEREEMSKEYAIAEAEMLQANADLKAAQEPV